ncbi:isochorismate synthase [Sporolactobacillus sp. CPB3-1]|uniref:isochorismate synthase n=1 Tax=Sporolactobacillus mangiferae TaxID=2940498 RepID=A0ABT0MA51_9BACL|nr:isochorismate synthase [Sporolactobacillus mangiferae]MCL1631752.1 isochorismate synthase [Sporolactobacillus mangiferae]
MKLTFNKEKDLYRLISKEIERANSTRCPQVVSEIKVIEQIEPLDFYRAAGKIADGERFYWEQQVDQFALVGAGIAASTRTEGRSGYLAVRDMQSQLLRSATVCGSEGVTGTGPLIFGGFAFDSDKQSSKDWSLFGSGYFFLPEWLLTVYGQHCYLTRSVVCRPGDHAEAFIKKMKIQEHKLFSNLTEIKTESFIEKHNLLKYQTDQNKLEWNKLLNEAIHAIMSSELNKIVLARSRVLVYQDTLASESVLHALHEKQRGTCVFCLENGRSAFLGATPERLIKKSGSHIESACLAGSAARGDTNEEDRRLGEWLLHDSKNRIEHEYVVTTIRKALAEVCRQLSIPEQPLLMKNKYIQHLYTPVTGVCDERASIVQLVERLHPTPALGGLPRQNAISWIRGHEMLDRGFYGSPLGWCDGEGNGDFHVAIRSALIHKETAVLFAGCGVVRDSDPNQEFEETALKFSPMLRALSGR